MKGVQTRSHSDGSFTSDYSCTFSGGCCYRCFCLKKIETLIEDIETVFALPHEFDADRLERFGQRLAKTVARKVNPSAHGFSLRMSNLGTKCNRKLWYKQNVPNSGEKLFFHKTVSFMYGDILEDLLLFLAEEAGHTVDGCQDELELNGVIGHRDAIIDGVLVDVKSASTLSFQKFKKHLTKDVDDFGYIEQLQAYLQASQNDPKVVEKSRAAFFVIDKTLGHMCLDFHNLERYSMAEVVEFKRKAINSEQPPERWYSDEPEGASGNRKLGVACSYCEVKKLCWPNVRTFLYSSKPVHLTVVKRLPNVPEANG